jgi:hypothetical protein
LSSKGGTMHMKFDVWLGFHAFQGYCFLCTISKGTVSFAEPSPWFKISKFAHDY